MEIYKALDSNIKLIVI